MKPEELLEKARRAAAAAYAPYSGLEIGAVAVGEDGRMFFGANVENAAYGSTMCAESVAIGSAIAAGATRIETVAVVTHDGQSVPPCGNCRQIMNEFGVTKVIIAAGDGQATTLGITDVLPNSFDSAHLDGTSSD